MKGICCGAIILFSLSIGLYESKNLQLASHQNHQTSVSRQKMKVWTAKPQYKQQLQQAKVLISFPFVDYHMQQQIKNGYKVQAEGSVKHRLVFNKVGMIERVGQQQKIAKPNRKEIKKWARNNKDQKGLGVYKWKKKDINYNPEGKTNCLAGKQQQFKPAVPNVGFKFSGADKKPHNHPSSPHCHLKVGKSKRQIEAKLAEAEPPVRNITTSSPIQHPHITKNRSCIEISNLTNQLDQIQLGDQRKHRKRLCKRRVNLCKFSASKEDNFRNESPPSHQHNSDENQQQQLMHNAVANGVANGVPKVLQLVQQAPNSPADDYQLTPFVRLPMTPTPSTPLSLPEAGDTPTPLHSHGKTQPGDHSQKPKLTVKQLLSRSKKKRNSEGLVFTFDVTEIPAHQIASLEYARLKSMRSKSKSRSRSHTRSRKNSQRGKSLKQTSVVEAKLKASEQNSKYVKHVLKDHCVDKPYRTSNIHSWKPYGIKVVGQHEIEHIPKQKQTKLQNPSKIKDLVNYFEKLSKDQMVGSKVGRRRSRMKSLTKRTRKLPVKSGEAQSGFIHYRLQQVNEHLQEDVFEKQTN